MSTSVAKDADTKNGGDESNGVDVWAMCPKVSLLTDRFGNSIYFGNAGSFWFPPFPIGPDNDYRSHVTSITNTAIRDDDVLICSYPKTGLHWHMEMINMLRNKTTQYTKEGLFFKYSMDVNPTTPTGDTEPGKPRLLATHVPFGCIPKQALKKRVKILYLNRNPKDVMVAFYNHITNHNPPLNFPGTFEQFVRLHLEVGYLYGSWFDHTVSFQKGIQENPDAQLFTSLYEDMKRDTAGGVKKLNKFLCTGCSEELCEEIAEACSIRNMKAFKDENKTDIEKALFKKDYTTFYRKGEVGDWKNWFSPELNKDFDEACQRILADCPMKFQYE